MQPDELRKMYQLEDSYWWFVGRRRLVRGLIERHAPRRDRLRILDAGCGTGGTLQALGRIGDLWGCDLAPEALQMCRHRGLERVNQSPVEEMDFADASFDVVISCDVLEHVRDDACAMQEMVRVLAPGGICVLTVPAHRWLWSQHDEALDHLRRYETKPFRRLLEDAGLRVELYSKAVAIAMPAILAAVAYRRLRRAFSRSEEGPLQTGLFELPRPLNSILIWLLGLEARLMRYISLPVGASLVAVARKPEDGVER